MLIRMLTISAGPQGCLDAGVRLDVDAGRARELVDRGFAEALEPFPAPVPTRDPEPPPVEDETEPEPPSAEAEAEPALEEEPEPQPTAVESPPTTARKKAK